MKISGKEETRQTKTKGFKMARRISGKDPLAYLGMIEGESNSPQLYNSVSRDPVASDAEGKFIGDIWVNSSTNDTFMLTSGTHWEPISATAGGAASISKYVVDADGSGDYTTIQAAIDAANAAGVDATIVVRPGTYTESLTLYSGIDVMGAIYGGATITGVHTPPAAGTIVFQNLTLTSATHIFSSAAAGTTEIDLDDCNITVTNGYVFNLANWTGTLSCLNLYADGTNDGVVNNTGGADFVAYACGLGAGNGNSMVTSGNVTMEACDLYCPFNPQTGSVIDANFCTFALTTTTANNSTGEFTGCKFETGANAVFSHGSTGSIGLYQCSIDSSNATPIGGAGAGALDLGNIDFVQNSAIANTLTVTYSRATDRISPYIVGPTGNYATIQAALDAANASAVAQTVYVQSGTYTEDLTLYDSINIFGATIDNTTITGTHTPPASGDIEFHNITLTDADDIFNSAVAGTTNITLTYCTYACTSGYLFNLVNWTGNLTVEQTGAAGTDDGFVNNTGGAAVFVHSSRVGDGGPGGNNAVLSGATTFYNSDVRCQIGQTASTIDIVGGTIDYDITLSNAAALTMNNTYSEGAIVLGDTSSGIVHNSTFSTGAAAAIAQSSTGEIHLINSVISTSSDPAIDGAGAGNVLLSGVEFPDGSNLAATLTLVYPAETRSAKLICGDATYPVNELTNEYNVIQAFFNTTATIAQQINAMEGNMDVASGASILQPTGVYGYCEQSDGSAVTSTAAGVEGHLNLLETDNADLPPTYAFAVKGYLDATDAAGIPAGMTAGIGSVVEYNTPFNAKAYGFVATRLDVGGGAGTAGQAAYGVLQGTVAIADWLYGLDLYNGASGVAYTTADIRFQNEATIAVDTEGLICSGDIASRNINNTNTKMVPVTMAPVMATKANTGGVPTGATGDENLMVMQQGEILEQHINGAGQTIIAPVMDATGLLISLDLTDNEGAEYSWGILGTNRHAYTIGTDAAFFFECKIKLADVTGVDPLYIGFRKQEAYQGTFTAYTDYAFIGVEETQNSALITIADELNGGGTTYTNTTDAWADGETHTLRVNVSAAGVVTYLIDGVAPSATHAFTFDNTDVVMPCLYFLHGTTTPGEIHLIEMECGFQAWN